MLKYRALMLTLSVFLLEGLLRLAGNFFTHQLITSLPTSNNNISSGDIVYAISVIELVLRLVGTYLIASYFLNQTKEKTSTSRENSF
jgi:hypothetical protein